MESKHQMSPAGEALSDVIAETTHTFFRLREVGSRYGALAPLGGTTLGLLRMLRLEGPQTVAQIVRLRPVARQHVQKLAHDLATQGLIELLDSPGQRRAKLLRLTPKGEEAFDHLYERFVALTEEVAKELDEQTLRHLATSLRRVRERLEKV